MATASRPSTTGTGANRATRRASTKKSTSTAAKSTTAKKAAPKKPTVSVEDVVEEEAPQSEAHATLADIDAEVAEIPDHPPFVFDTVGNGNEEDCVVIGSPGDVPYAIASSSSLDAVFSYAMSDEDWNKFINADLTTAQAGLVFVKWRQHYGMGSQGE